MKIDPLTNKLFGSKEIKVSKITTGKFNTSYLLTDSAHEYVLRIAPDPGTSVLFYEKEMMRREPDIHSLVESKTDVPIPHIIEYDFSHTVVQNDWLLMEKLPGAPLSASPLWGAKADFLFYQLGKTLREVHCIQNVWHGYPDGSNTGPRESNWYNAFKNIWNRLLEDIVTTGLYGIQKQARLSTLLEKHSRAFTHDPKPSLLHMDIWSQNILIGSDGELLGLVDWDRGLWGDPEIEFSVLEYCGTSPEAFWRGYGKQIERTSDYEIRRNFYLLYEHQKYIYIRSQRDREPKLAQKYAAESLAWASRLE